MSLANMLTCGMRGCETCRSFPIPGTYILSLDIIRVVFRLILCTVMVNTLSHRGWQYADLVFISSPLSVELLSNEAMWVAGQD